MRPFTYTRSTSVDDALKAYAGVLMSADRRRNKLSRPDEDGRGTSGAPGRYLTPAVNRD